MARDRKKKADKCNHNINQRENKSKAQKMLWNTKNRWHAINEYGAN
jgi:hypothetical protein